MPLLQLTLSGTPLQTKQRLQAAEGLTRLMCDLLQKRSDLTVVNILQTSSEDWFAGGLDLEKEQWCASLQVYISKDTNTDDEISSFIHAANDLICKTMRVSASAPVYTVVNQIPSGHWGYDGQTQLQRKLASQVIP